jgi:tetratricopeptide (TPR) repeat protein
MLNTFRGNYQEAQSYYERSLELNPNDAFTYGVYGLLMRWGLGQFAQAVTLHERNVQVDPLDYTANLQLGTSYWRVQRHDDARRQYEKAIRICPGCGEAYQSYSGMLAAGLGRVDEGLAVRYRMFAELDEEPTPRQLVGTASGHLALADMETALKYITAAMSLVPEGRFDEFLVPFYLDLGKLDEAREIAEPYLQSTKTAPPWVVNTQDRMDLDQGEPERALERYRSIAPGLFDEPPDVEKWSGLVTYDLFRVLVAAEQEAQLLRILGEMELTLPDEYGVFQLLYAGQLDQAIAMVRGEYPDGVIQPQYCKSLQDELPWLPGSIDAENPKLQALIEDACAERERQLANVRRGFDSGKYRLPEIVLKAKPVSNN